MPNLLWDDDDISRLQALWAEGHSTNEIARRMGASKNAIVGKAHRLNLPARPSPIRRDTDPKATPRRRRTERVRGATLPALASVISPSQEAAQPSSPPAPCAAASPPIIRAVKGRVVSCCWPEGEPRTKAFRFCESPSEPGRQYCAKHCGAAFVYRQRRAG